MTSILQPKLKHSKMIENIDSIKQLLIKGNIDIAFKKIKERVSTKNSDALSLLETRYRKYKSDKIRGLLLNDIELNDVNSSLLNLLKAEENNKSIDISNPNSKIYNITIMGDTYNVKQAGAVGPNSSSTNDTFIQQNNDLPENYDYDKLYNELLTLKSSLIQNATLPEHFQAIAEVASAENSAKEKNGSSVLQHLKSAGKWVFDFATKVGTSVVSDLIKAQLH